MENVSNEEGRTILFVSHNMGAIRQICTRVINLDEGHIVFDGDVGSGIAEYLHSCFNDEGEGLKPKQFSGSLAKTIIFKEIFINGSNQNDLIISPSTPIHVSVTGFSKRDIPKMAIAFALFKDDNKLFTQHDGVQPELLPAGKFECEFSIKEYTLRPGEYSIAVGGYSDNGADQIMGTYLRRFSIAEEWDENFNYFDEGIFNVPYPGKRRIIPE
jgi:lipopolysaccharide transport system ATP-binding protein